MKTHILSQEEAQDIALLGTNLIHKKMRYFTVGFWKHVQFYRKFTDFTSPIGLYFKGDMQRFVTKLMKK